MADVVSETVSYPSEGLTCAADIYHPVDAGDGPYPAIIAIQGFSGVKGISVDVGTFYANHGYLVLAIDVRGFGDSEGEPRGELFPLRQVEDVRNAVSYLETHADVDANRIGLWGTSFSGGVVLYAAAVDRRIKAVISQIPVVDGQRWHKNLRTTVEYDALLRALDEDRRRRYQGLPSQRIPVSGVGSKDGIVAMPADQEIVDLLAQFGAAFPTWSPEITLESIEKIIEYSPMSVIDRIAPRPLLMITVSGYDISHPACDVVEAFERARQPKELLVLPYSQLGLYSGEGLQDSLQQQLRFLRRHLPA